MAVYSFKCFEDEGGCGHEFEVIMSPSTYKSEQTCPLCRKKKCVHRNYAEDGVEAQVRLSDSEIKTVGHLAGRNTEKMTDEQIAQLERKNRAHAMQRSTIDKMEQAGKLPSGMKKFSPSKKFEKTPAERLERSKELRALAKERAAEMKEKRRKERLENSPKPNKRPTIIQ